MTKERDYLTLDEVEEYTGIKKNSLYYYLKTLGIETHKFNLDRRAYISLTDANRIKAVKDTPWLAGERPSEKGKKQPVLPVPIVDSPKTEVSQISIVEPKRSYVRKKESGLPEGCILASAFAKVHGVNERSFYDHMVIGLGPGLVGTHTDMMPERDHVDYSERTKPSRPKEKERYLTSEQQAAALDFWRRHGVRFSQCERPECPCHQ